MQNREAAAALAAAMEAAGDLGGVPVRTVLSPMDQPLGRAAGNAVEVQECIDTLQGRGPEDLIALTLDLAAALSDTPREIMLQRLTGGPAWEKFQHMTRTQGGNLAALPTARHQLVLPAPQSGTIANVDALLIGQAVMALGGGRARAEDTVDHCAGISAMLQQGDPIQTGQPLCTLHSSNPDALQPAAALAAQAFQFS